MGGSGLPVYWEFPRLRVTTTLQECGMYGLVNKSSTNVHFCSNNYSWQSLRTTYSDIIHLFYFLSRRSNVEFIILLDKQ